MPKLVPELTDMAVKNIKEPGIHVVGGVPGLALQIGATRETASRTPQTIQSRSWLLRYTFRGRRRDMGLGSYPEVSLKAARDAARAARDLVRSGVDPIEKRRTERAASAVAPKTFKQCAKEYIADRRLEWKNDKHREQWANTLETYVYPVFGDRPVAEISLAEVLEALRPIWWKKTETAKRVRGRIEVILDWATTLTYRSGENPARWRGHLENVLPRPSKVAKVKHHRALRLGQLGNFVRDLRMVEGIGARALDFLILTAARSGEVRHATWEEIDLDAKVWTIPAERMKAGKEHRVPLSADAVDLLESLRVMAGTPLIFPSSRNGPLSDMTLSAVCRRMKVDAVPHGFRSTFKDWASEVSSYPSDLAEIALAHSVGNKVEQAYRRGDALERRRSMMTEWAEYASKPRENEGVTPLRRSALP